MCFQIKGNSNKLDLLKLNPVGNDKNIPAPSLKPVLVKDTVSLKNIQKENKFTAICVDLSLKPRPCLTPTFNPDLSTAEIFQKIDSLQAEYRITKPLSAVQKKDIEKFSPDQRKMFSKALNELESFRDKKTDASQYMINIMQYASELSGNDSRKFVKLVGEVFSEIPDALDFFRKVLGAGPKTAGGILEPLLEEVIKQRGGSGPEAGFNENMTDDIDINNTMTHHIGEFIQVGFNRGETLGKLAADVIDRDVKIIGMKLNEGDVRSGYFTSMIGRGLKTNKINPQEAVNLIKWAYTSHHTGKSEPIFSSKETQGQFMNWKDYKLDDWLQAYNKAFPPKT